MSFFAPFLLGASLPTAVAIYLLLHPEVFQKWVGMIFYVIAVVWKKADYIAIKNDVQGKINSYISNLEAKTTIPLPRITVQWAKVGEHEEIIWEDYEAVIVMRDRKHRNKNFVHAAYFFTSEVLLKKPKRHLSKLLKTSLDIFATKKLLELESKASVDQFMSDYFSPQIEKSSDVREFIKQYVTIDKLGIFFPVLIQELTYLGNKVFLDHPTEEVLKEVKQLITFLEKFALREVGDNTVQDSYAGNYLKCAIRIIASKQIRLAGYTEPNRQRIANAIANQFENIYVIGSAEPDNRKYVDGIINELLVQYPTIVVERKIVFPGQIIQHERLTKVTTYFIHIHNPEAITHIQ